MQVRVSGQDGQTKTFDEPASFSAGAAEYTPASARSESFDGPAHELSPFFLAAAADTRSLAVVDCVCNTTAVVEAAGRYGRVSGVDDSYVAQGVVFLQFDAV